MRARVAAAALVAFPLFFSTAAAQSPDSIGAGGAAPSSGGASSGGGWLFAYSVGVPGYGGEAVAELMTVGVQWTQARPFRLGGDFAVGTMPSALSAGVAVVGMRAGTAFPLRLAPGVLLLPSGGMSGVVGVSPGGGGALLGANAGLAAAVTGRRGVGARVGMTFHRFTESNGAIWLLEMGMVTGPRR